MTLISYNDIIIINNTNEIMEEKIMTCTFFGHSDTPPTVRGQLKDTLITLIETRGADLFYIGNHGGFDRMAEGVLLSLIHISEPTRQYS